MTEIGGDLVAENNGLLTSLSSASLETVGGVFQLHNLTALSNLAFTKLTEVGSIDWATLTVLPELTFGNPGVTKAEKVVIGDTFLENIDGINVESLSDLNLNNNRRLTKFSTSIQSLTNLLNIQANGLNLKMEMPNLEWIANMTVSNVTTFSVPSLHTVNGSIRFDSNYFESFVAANLTDVKEGDVSFVSNPQLTNISFPGLEHIGGGFTIANNTELVKLDGFPALTDVGGAVALRGSFDEVSMSKINNVVGGFEILSTAQIQSVCDSFQKKKDDGEIQGEYNCVPGKSDANDDTGDADGSTGNGGSSDSSDDKDGAGAALGMDMTTLASLAALGVFFTTFL